MLKVFWGIAPPPPPPPQKMLKTGETLIKDVKKVLKTGEMLKMLKMLKVLQGISPPFLGGGQSPLTFLTLPQF